MNIADQSLVKKINKKLILNEVIKNSPISRANLSKITGLNKSTISSQVNTLIKEKFIFEIGQGQSSGGRKPVMLVFNKNAGYAVGIDIGVDYMNGILTDLEGNIVLNKYYTLENSSPKTTQSTLFNIIQQFINHVPDSPYGLAGIGVCVPGLVDRDQKVIFTPNSNGTNMDLKTLIEEKFNLPVFVENEANAGAYGEKVFGAAKNYDDIIYVSVSTGIGIGIIMNNDLYRGVNGFSGEMGHMTIDFNGPKCSCGNRGCWELYASEKAVLNSIREKNNTLNSLEEVIRLVHQNDLGILSSLQNFGFYVGIGLTNIINTFDPQAVILRSSIVESHPMVLNSIKNTLSSRIYPQLNNCSKLLPSILGKNAPALGTSSIVIEHFLDRVTA